MSEKRDLTELERLVWSAAFALGVSNNEDPVDLANAAVHELQAAREKDASMGEQL